MLGHSDRAGTGNDPRAQSWNSAHPSRGCSQDGLRSTGGVGLFYCFATIPEWRSDRNGGRAGRHLFTDGPSLVSIGRRKDKEQ